MSGLSQIKASAGSGKTYTITRRFLELLHFGQLEEIVAITFTNAAAEEMRARIIRRLKELALSLDTNGELSALEARSTLTQIFANFSLLNVRTIDSLLLQIVRTSALQLHFNPDFQPVFTTEETIEPYLELFCDRARLGDTELDSFFKQVIASIYYEERATGFRAGTKLQDRLAPLFDALLLNQMENIADASTLQAKRAQLQKQICADAQAFLSQSEKLKLSKNAQTALGRLRDGQFAKAFESVYFSKDSAAALFNKGSIPTEALEELYSSIKETKVTLQQLTSALRIAPFVALGQRLIKAFMAHERSGAFLHTVLVPILVRAILEGEGVSPVSDALFRLGTSIRHMLIDEFQDTSDAQWFALFPLVQEALANGGSFTWVGDIKQSIFSWRGGNPLLFDAVLNDATLARQCGNNRKTETLPTNWRSLAEIIAFNNELYAPLADAQKCRALLVPFADSLGTTFEETLQTLVSAYTQASQKVSPTKENRAFKGFVSVTDCQAEDELATVVATVEEIAQRRPLSDLLILVHKNDQARAIAQALLEKSIPAITENSLLLGEHPLIIETVALMRYVVTRDAISLLTLLKGAIVNDAYASTLFAPTHFQEALLAQDPLEPEELLRSLFAEFWAYAFAPFVDSAHLTPYDFVSEWYGYFQVEQRFPSCSIFLRRFLEILHSAEKEQCTTLSAFLEFWEGTKTHAKEQEKVPMPEHTNACRIMTIFKAKGLEAPCVLLPWKQHLGISKKLLFMDTADGLHLALLTGPHTPKEQAKEHQRDLIEELNVLYVATTRAVEELHILHILPTARAQSKDILHLLTEAAGLTFPITRGDTPPVKERVQEESAEQIKSASSVKVQNEAPLKPMQWLPEIVRSFDPHEENDHEYRALERGTILHKALEVALLNDTPQVCARRALTHAYLTHAGALPKEEEFLALQASLCWFFNEPKASFWLTHGQREYSLLTSKGKLLRCDLLVQEQAGLLILDYKSGEPEEAHISQLTRYLEVLKPKAHRVGGLLVYLDRQEFQFVGLNGPGTFQKESRLCFEEAGWDSADHEEVC